MQEETQNIPNNERYKQSGDDVTRVTAKYIFMDVVGFSKRSAEAQSEIVSAFNNIVQEILDAWKLTSDDDRILIPTGDGMCIALIGSQVQFDSHLLIATKILDALESYNETTEDETRRFNVRIGINQNTDIVIVDVNGKKNVAGAGINLASRIMDQADGGQILVSQAVHHELQPSEIYMNSFRSYPAKGKHGISFSVYQFVSGGLRGLDCDVPSPFRTSTPVERKLPLETAYYFAVAILNKAELLRLKKERKYYFSSTPIMLFRLLAKDYYEQSKTPEHLREDDFYTKGFGQWSFEEQLAYYKAQDSWMSNTAESAIVNLENYYGLGLANFAAYFELHEFSYYFEFVNDAGREKLKAEWPDVWAEFNLT